MMYFLFIVLLCLTFFCHLTAEPCKTPNGAKGNCISIYNCSELLTALATLNTSQIQFVQRSQCGYDKNPLVCCPEKNVENKQTKNGQDLLPSRRYCGYQHNDDYVVEGTQIKAKIDEFPWLASLIFLNEVNETEFLCSGVLINNRYVLTAAHCTMDASKTLVGARLGEYNIEKSKDCADYGQFEECADPVADYNVENTLVHPEYSLRTKANDLALLRLNTSVSYSDFIRPICLPLPGIKLAETGEILTFSGWGRSSFAGAPVDIKKKGLTKLIPLEECNEMYKNRHINITSKQMCTRIKDSSAAVSCQGDSGGPVMFVNKNQWHVEGIISFSSACGVGVIDVNTNVASYLDWIIESIKA